MLTPGTLVRLTDSITLTKNTGPAATAEQTVGETARGDIAIIISSYEANGESNEYYVMTAAGLLGWQFTQYFVEI